MLEKERHRMRDIKRERKIEIDREKETMRGGDR